jgi:5,10-methylenetetrahydromethanopterin reductase
VGLTLIGNLPARAVAGAAEAAEAAGFESLWMHETYYQRDAWTALAAAATRVRRLGLATGCIGPFTRHPALIAMSLASLMELTPGPVLLGLGSAYRERLDEMGVPAQGRAPAVAAAITIVRALCAGATVDRPEPPFAMRGVRLAFPCRQVPPVYVAGWRPRMLRICATLGDGYLARPVESPPGLRRLLGRIGRRVDVAACILCHLDSDGARARAEARRAPFLLYQFSVMEPEALAEVDVDPEVRTAIAAALRAGDAAAASRLVSDRMLDAFTAVGTPQEVAERLAAYAASGVDLPLLQPLFPEDCAALIAFGRRYAAG